MNAPSQVQWPEGPVCLPTMGTRGQRIRQVRDAMGLSQQAFGERLGVEKAAVWNWEHDQVDSLRSDNLIAMERVSGFSAAWIETGKGPERVIAEDQALYNVSQGPDVRPVPLISWVQAGAWEEAVDNFRPGEGEKSVWTTRRTGPRSYALRVIGDSMENPAGRPTYPAGSIIIVDPEKQAENLSAVVVRLVNSKEATFKQLIVQGGERHLKPLNPRYPIMPLDEAAMLCGVVVQTIMDED